MKIYFGSGQKLKNCVNNIFHVKAIKSLIFVSNKVTQYFSCLVSLLSSTNLTLKKIFLSLSRGKYSLKHLEIVKRLKK